MRSTLHHLAFFTPPFASKDNPPVCNRPSSTDTIFKRECPRSCRMHEVKNEVWLKVSNRNSAFLWKQTFWTSWKSHYVLILLTLCYQRSKMKYLFYYSYSCTWEPMFTIEWKVTFILSGLSGINLEKKHQGPQESVGMCALRFWNDKTLLAKQFLGFWNNNMIILLKELQLDLEYWYSTQWCKVLQEYFKMCPLIISS